MYPCLKVFYELRIEGKLIGRRRLSRSFVTAYNRLLCASMAGVTTPQFYDITHTLRTTTPSTVWSNIAGGIIDVSNKGVVIGSGSTAVTPSDYAMQTQIATGNGAGQIRHLAQSYNSPVTDGTGTYWQVVRPFINNSGATINIREFGIYGVDNAPQTFCIVRDVLGADVPILAGKTFTLTYTFRADI